MYGENFASQNSFGLPTNAQLSAYPAPSSGEEHTQLSAYSGKVYISK